MKVQIRPRGASNVKLKFYPGIRGEPGEIGPVGPANSLAIGTVTTGAAGSSAEATITGEAPNQTLSLVIPAGVKGDPGDITPEFLALAEQISADASTASTKAGQAAGSATSAATSAANAHADYLTIQGLLNMPLDMGSQSEPYAQTYDLGIQGT